MPLGAEDGGNGHLGTAGCRPVACLEHRRSRVYGFGALAEAPLKARARHRVIDYNGGCGQPAARLHVREGRAPDLR